MGTFGILLGKTRRKNGIGKWDFLDGKRNLEWERGKNRIFGRKRGIKMGFLDRKKGLGGKRGKNGIRKEKGVKMRFLGGKEG